MEDLKQVIEKAIEGGFEDLTVTQFNLFKEGKLYPQIFLMKSSFWQALGKSCGWAKQDMKNHIPYCDVISRQVRDLANEPKNDCTLCIALRFHEINLTEGWEEGVKYLSTLLEQK